MNIRLLLVVATLPRLASAQDPGADPFKGLWKPVDLELKDGDARAALERLCRDAGEPFRLPATAAPKKVTARLKGATLWQAVDEVCRRHGTLRHVRIWARNRESEIEALPWVEAPVWYQGPLRLQVADVARHREARYPDRLDRTEVALALQWLKTFVPVRDLRFMPGVLRITRAEDDTGKSLLPLLEIDRQFTSEMSNGGEFPGYSWLFRLQPAAPAAKAVAVLEGEWEGRFLSDLEEVTFKEPAEGAERPADPLTVTLVKFTRNTFDEREQYGYVVRVSYDPAKVPEEWKESLKSVPLADRVQTESRAGPGGTNILSKSRKNNPDEPWAEFSGFLRPAEGKAPEVTIRIARSVRSARAPFSFKKVPLPEVPK